jgi:3-oxoacyl-[acyl-carrier-protein] synthase-1
MRDVFIISDNILSPLGFTAAENFDHLLKSASGIKMHVDDSMSDVPFYASLIDNLDGLVNDTAGFTKFEQLLIASVNGALENCAVDPSDKKTILIISTIGQY